MNIKSRFFTGLILITITALLAGPVPQTAVPSHSAAYVEPGLLASAGDALSVIVTAEDSTAAVRAVARAGGQVTSDLWLIDGVAATLPVTR